MADTAKEAFDAMPGRFKAEAAAGMNAVYQYCIEGDGGGDWNCVIANGALTVNEGKNDSSNVTLTMAAPDFMDLVNGKLNGQMAFMAGKIKIAGNVSLAMKLGALFGL